MTLHRRMFLCGVAAAAAAPGLVSAQSKTVRLRGTIEALTADKLTLMERSGKRMELALSPNWTVTEVYPVKLSDVTAGSFVGVGGMPQPDGSQKAIAVVLFPENMRGTGEGHYPFDFLPQSTMTNATVADVARSPDGERLELKYKNGEKTIIVPPEAPIVSLRPGERGMVQVGQRVAVNVQDINGTPTVIRVNAGRNGFAPPY